MGKHTPGPFTVRQPEIWPFDIEVVNQDGEIMWSERRHAHASRQKTVDECMRAVGFDYDERPAIIEQLERQLRDIHLRAASPDLLEALRQVIADKAPKYHDCADDGLDECAWCAAHAAIAKAEGRP